MNEKANTYRFGDWVVEPQLNLVRRDSQEVQLEPLTMNVLAHLLVHAGEVVANETLLDLYWAGRSAEPGHGGSVHQPNTPRAGRSSTAPSVR